MKRTLKIAFSLVVAGVLLYLFFRKVDPAELGANIRQADPLWLVISMLLQALHLVIRAVRWRALLSPIKKRIGFYNLFSTTAIGYMLSLLFFRVGEVVRPMILGQRENISRTGALATCVLERLMDFFVVALLFGLYLMTGFEPPSHAPAGLDIGQLRAVGLIFGIGTLACFPILYVIVHYRRPLTALLERRMGDDAAVPRLLHAFLGGFDAVRGGRLLTLAWVQSLLVWLTIAAAIWAALRAFALDIGFLDSFFIMGLLAFGIAVPTPGGVGSFEYLGGLGLEFLGVAPNVAAASILVTHVVSIAPVMVIGFVLLWRDGLSLRGLSRIGEEARTGSPGPGVGA